MDLIRYATEGYAYIKEVISLDIVDNDGVAEHHIKYVGNALYDTGLHTLNAHPHSIPLRSGVTIITEAQFNAHLATSAPVPANILSQAEIDRRIYLIDYYGNSYKANAARRTWFLHSKGFDIIDDDPRNQ